MLPAAGLLWWPWSEAGEAACQGATPGAEAVGRVGIVAQCADQQSLFGLLDRPSDGTTDVLHEYLACRGRGKITATLLAREDAGRLEGTIITGRCHQQLLCREHVKGGNCGSP